ncbi:hypothetical protein GX50_03615 [[Emmonsia] crescens]|uniref:PD-(D/E)XK nuclease-like domain-containing protein n=1 Tax=[Emmonsia] crescens TaxID=73230 RepID=A0A2B7ZK42_9EURO|nr:hypothetical protein GX50_03615 [Emmonsia crescens]
MASKLKRSKRESIHSWLDEVADSLSSCHEPGVTGKQDMLQTWPQQHRKRTRSSMDPVPQRKPRPRAKKRSGSDMPEMTRKKANIEGTETSRAGPRDKEKAKSSQVQFERVDDRDDHETEAGYSYYHPESRYSSGNISIRRQHFRLRFSTPAVHFVPFGEQNRPQSVTELFRDLIKGNEQPIPNSLRNLLKARYPSDFTIETGDNPTDVGVSHHDDQLWKAMTEAFNEATKAQRRGYDENGWSGVVKTLLKGSLNDMAPDNPRPHMFEVSDVQTVSIGPVSLVPVRHGCPILLKKVDFSISFSRDDPEIGNFYENIHKRWDLSLSQTEDPLVGYECQIAAIEIKSPDGIYDSSSLQLATWLAAGLENMRLLQARAREVRGIQGEDENGLLPFIGITAVGHVWSLHIASKEKDGTVRLYGPLPMGDTCSGFGVFQILNVLGRVRTWGQNVYFPWLKENILSPLAGATVGV